MDIFPWILSVLGSLVMIGFGFIKSNPEVVKLGKIDPILWWLFCESWLTWVGITNFSFVKGKLDGDGFKTAIIFAATKMIVEICLYSYFFKWEPKYAIALILILLAGLVMKY